MKKQSIGIILNTLQVGGAEKQAILQAKALKGNHNVKLIVLYGSLCDQKLLDFVKVENIELIRLHGIFFKKLWLLYHTIKSNEIDYLFTYLATSNVVGGIIGKLSGVKYIIGGIRNSELSSFKQNIQRILHNHVFNYSIFNNFNGAKSLSEKGFDIKKIHVIPNCFDLTMEPTIRDTRKEITILSVGRFVEQKDYLTAITAIASLNVIVNQQYKFIYNIVGYGIMEKEIKSYITKYELDDVVEIFINPMNINSIYKRADVFLNTSLFEGQSNSMMEAMSFSLPVVCTDAGDNNKLVKNGVNGYIANIKDFNMLAEYLFSLCNSLELRNELGTNSYYHLKNNFSFTSFQDNYLKFIRNICI